MVSTRPTSICVVCHRRPPSGTENNHSQHDDSVPRRIRRTDRRPSATTTTATMLDPPERPTRLQAAALCGCHGTAPTESPQPGQLLGQSWPDGGSAVPAFTMRTTSRLPSQTHRRSGVPGLRGDGGAARDRQHPLNPTCSPSSKQLELCWFCHYDPGGADAITRTDPALRGRRHGRSPLAGSTSSRARTRCTTSESSRPAPIRLTRSTNSATTRPAGRTPSAHAGTGTCANLVCHNQATTPVGVGNDWNAPPVWSAAARRARPPPATPPDVHPRPHHPRRHHPEELRLHRVPRDNYRADHPDPPRPRQRQGRHALEQRRRRSRPPRAPTASTTRTARRRPSAGDTAFAYKTVPVQPHLQPRLLPRRRQRLGRRRPHAGLGQLRPPDSVYCGSCHDGNGTVAPDGDASVIATGNHTDHLSAA